MDSQNKRMLKLIALGVIITIIANVFMYLSK